MKKIISLTLITLTVNVMIAQKKITIGPYYTFGASTIMSMGNSMGMSGSMMNRSQGSNPVVSFKLGFGAGLRAEKLFNKHWGLYIQTGYQQRGGMFKQYMDSYKPRYNLNYWEVNIGGQYKTKGITNKPQFIINLGLTQHTLLGAKRVYDMGSDNMKGDFGKADFGLFLSIGTNIPMFEKDYFQIQLFANQGFSQIYSGNMSMNNMNGRNLLIGIQIGYQIGKPVKKEVQQ